MATTDIVPDGDLSPLQFQLIGAATHTAALNSATNDLKELQGQQAGLTDHISLSTPSPTITEATNVRFKLWMRYTLNISASTFGYRLELYKNNGADLLGSKSQLFSSTGTPYEVIFDVPCSFGEADKSSLSFKIVTYGTGWGSFQAITAIEACTLVRVTYTAASPPVADFSGTPTAGTADLDVDFTDLSTNTPTSWSWDFGDSVGTSTSQNPSYTYTSSGIYDVSLTATNAGGSDDEVKTGYITVNAPLPDKSLDGNTRQAQPITATAGLADGETSNATIAQAETATAGQSKALTGTAGTAKAVN